MADLFSPVLVPPPRPCRTFFPSITCQSELDALRSISCPSQLPFNKISAQEGQVFYFGLSGSHSSGWLTTGSCFFLGGGHSYTIQIIQDKSKGRVTERQEQQAGRHEEGRAVTGCFCSLVQLLLISMRSVQENFLVECAPFHLSPSSLLSLMVPQICHEKATSAQME